MNIFFILKIKYIKFVTDGYQLSLKDSYGIIIAYFYVSIIFPEQAHRFTYKKD